MKIRKATQSDLPQICQLYYDTINSVNTKDYTPEQIKIWSAAYKNTDSWARKINEQHFFVEEKDGQITGFASITDDGYLDYMYVHKDFQGQSIAAELLKVLEQIAKKLNLKEIRAKVSITARPFFKSKGFEITKVYFTKVGEVEFEDCVMTKIITRSEATKQSNNNTV